MENSQKLIVVIAANKMIYGHFLSANQLSFRNENPYRYVGPEHEAAKRLRGQRNLDFICIENYKEREDLKEIFETLEMCNIGTELEGKARVYEVLYS